jgi:hypothetical protein
MRNDCTSCARLLHTHFHSFINSTTTNRYKRKTKKISLRNANENGSILWRYTSIERWVVVYNRVVEQSLQTISDERKHWKRDPNHEALEIHSQSTESFRYNQYFILIFSIYRTELSINKWKTKDKTNKNLPWAILLIERCLGCINWLLASNAFSSKKKRILSPLVKK